MNTEMRYGYRVRKGVETKMGFGAKALFHQT